jgi:diketogulonate reductase-like aldo/keto reductase
VRALCKEDEILFKTYASLGAGSLGLIDNNVVKMVTIKVGVREAQVLLNMYLLTRFLSNFMDQPP